MSTHVDLAGALFVVWGVLTTLIGLSTLALGVGATALAASAARQDSGAQIAAGLTAATFIALALIAIVWGAAHVTVGLLLRQRRQWTRLAALMLATIDLFLVPYGTALGAYSLWALLSEEGRGLFVPRH